MLLQIAQPLPPARLSRCQTLAAEDPLFGSGRTTAG